MRPCSRTIRAAHPALVLAIAVLSTPLLPSAVAARKAYRAESYHVTLQVQPDGSVGVREEIRVRFEGGPFTFFYRGIPTSRTDGIDLIGHSDSARVRTRKSRLDVTWRFAPSQDTVRTFVVEYLARGVLYDDRGHRRLRWVAFPQERAYVIDEAAAVVLFPPDTPPPTSFVTEPGGGFSPEEPPWAQGPCLTLPARRLGENQNVVLQVDLAPGVLAGGEPAWRLERQRWRDRRPGVLAVSGALLGLGLLWVIRQRANFMAALAPGTVGSPRGSRAGVVGAPPEDASPALSGALLLGQPAMPHAFGALLDLARRGVLRLDPGRPQSRWVSPRPKLRRGDVSVDLEPWETALLNAVFERAHADGSADWRQAASTLGRRFGLFSRAVQDGLVRRGALDPAGLDGRQAMKRLILLLLVPDVVAAAAGIALLPALGPAAFLPLGAIVLVLAAAAIARATIPVRTRRGFELARSWRGFARHLKETSKGSTPMDAARFEAWLPHAVALGVATSLVNGARRWGLQPPGWFRSASGDMTGDLRALAYVVTVASTFGGAAGGGAGAAGGGSSGAG